MTEIISRTVRIRVSGHMIKEKARTMAECMNRMTQGDYGAPSIPFHAAPVNEELPDGSWAVFIRNTAIRCL